MGHAEVSHPFKYVPPEPSRQSRRLLTPTMTSSLESMSRISSGSHGPTTPPTQKFELGSIHIWSLMIRVLRRKAKLCVDFYPNKRRYHLYSMSLAVDRMKRRAPEKFNDTKARLSTGTPKPIKNPS
ncbi:hypothetical protein FRB94_006465 [Tulasnella sp. JGI-2019a]|nr:hypothetical protein FRB93_004104 [Tulasnella sp. JGI-2019a]KAG8999045.1 hypothetical protein FRB94_006465 [Tulasnella sp. JGI-2019a]KAG9023193.1 hypothetical protein FRB95_013419 [Tulasnella sp. JGI-2019a]